MDYSDWLMGDLRHCAWAPSWALARENNEIRVRARLTPPSPIGLHEYVWIKELGNKRVEQGRKGIEIKNPTAAKSLLNIALEEPQRRVIFFCSCAYPALCHRRVVGELVLKYAKEANARVSVVE